MKIGAKKHRVVLAGAAAFVLCLAAVPGLAKSSDTGEGGKWTFDRYQVILDSQLFGDPRAPVAPPPPPPGPPNPSESFIRDYRMCAITDGPDGLRVGIVRVRKVPPPRPGVPVQEVMEGSFFFKVGEVVDGIRLIQANYEDEKALLEKDGDQQWVGMTGPLGANVNGAPAAPTPAVAARPGMPGSPMLAPRVTSARPFSPGPASAVTRSAPPGVTMRPPSAPTVRPPAPPVADTVSAAPRYTSVRPVVPAVTPTLEMSSGTVNPAAMTYAERLQWRRDQREKRNAEIMASATNPARPSPEDLEKELQRINFENIKKGLPAMPIPLTREQDDELVRDNLLPPQTP